MDKEARIERERHFLVTMAFWAVILALVYFVLRYMVKMLMPFFLALVFASVSRPLARRLSAEVRWKKDEKGNRVPVRRGVHLSYVRYGQQ